MQTAPQTMVMSFFNLIRPAAPAKRLQARDHLSPAEKACHDFDRIAAEIAAQRPFDAATADLPDLELLEAATALSTQKK